MIKGNNQNSKQNNMQPARENAPKPRRSNFWLVEKWLEHVAKVLANIKLKQTLK